MATPATGWLNGTPSKGNNKKILLQQYTVITITHMYISLRILVFCIVSFVTKFTYDTQVRHDD